jgi:hypothetical protein
MFWRRHDDEATRRRNEASEALHRAVQEYYELQDLKPDVEATVRGHRKLQLDNHFAERIEKAYRGDF